MKLLEIEETEKMIVIKLAGSNVSRVVQKDSAMDVHEAFLEMLEEAPEQKSEEPQEEEKEQAQSTSDVEQAFKEGVEALGDLLKTPQAQKVKGLLERLPKTKRGRKAQ